MQQQPYCMRTLNNIPYCLSNLPNGVRVIVVSVT